MSVRKENGVCSPIGISVDGTIVGGVLVLGCGIWGEHIIMGGVLGVEEEPRGGSMVCGMWGTWFGTMKSL